MSPLFALLLVQAAPAVPSPPVVPDAELAQMRGGFRLPGGIEVALTVRSDTMVNGATVLRTIFTARDGGPEVAIYAPQGGTAVAPGAAGEGGSAAVDGVRVITRVGGPLVTIGGTPGGASDPVADGLVRIDAGAGVSTDNGVVTAVTDGGASRVDLQGAGIDVAHLVGGAFGTAIVNSANDRAIDTRTSVSIDLSNVGPDVLGSAMLRVQDIGDTIVRGRM